jgi:hypothetical protein
MAAKTELHDRQKLVTDLVQMKDSAARLGLYRTARLLEIPIQEIGWEMQDESTPAWQKKRQQETLTP